MAGRRSRADDVGMTPQDPPTATPGPAPNRLTRPAGDRMLLGVASGLARHFDLDPALVRIAFAVLALFGGTGVLLYVIIALVVPADDAPAAGPEVSRRNKILVATLVLLAVVTLPWHGLGFLYA